MNDVYTVFFHWVNIHFCRPAHTWFDMWKGDRYLVASFKCKLNFPLTPCHGYIIHLFSNASSNRSSSNRMCFNWCSHVWVRLATVASL